MLRATRTWVASAICACLVTCIATPDAAAQDDQRARLHFESGASYYEAGEYEDALREFQRAYELSHRPQLFYNLSLCYQNLGDLEQAASYLERFLAEVPNVENRANLEIRLRNLRERIARQRAGQPEPEPEPEPEPTGEPASPIATATTTTSTTTTSTPPGDAPLNVPAIVGFSVAALGLVTAAIFGPLTLAEDSWLSEQCGVTRTCTEDTVSTMRTFAAVTDVGLGVALAGAAVGLVFLIVGTGESTPGERGAIDVMPMASRDGAGVIVGGSF